MVANALDDTARELGARLAEMARRARAHGRDPHGHGRRRPAGRCRGAARADQSRGAERCCGCRTNPAARTTSNSCASPTCMRWWRARWPAIARRPWMWSSIPARGARSWRTSVPVDADRGGGAVLVLRDITDLRRADQVRRDFVANVSHELRTPLTAIRGYVEALLDAVRRSAEQTREFLGDHRPPVAAHGTAGARLAPPRTARCRPGDPGARRLPRGRPRGRRRSAISTEPCASGSRTCSVGDRAGRRAVVRADAAKLADALRNLLENASNYSPAGGRIEIGPAARRRRRPDHRRGPGAGHSRNGSHRGSSSASIAWIAHARAIPAARDSACRSSGIWWSCNGGRVTAANRDGGGAVFEVALPASEADSVPQ